ncbi:MAG: aminotransferase class I/II-fold pyridoxal phosphate-dependent enzyme [Halobacteriovoraceae bacterium]|jgi:aspartate aminotransferase|nr:aminotransferase class I/II-fold pyridoxal phosphate-dependent enzyme [Halobacteriovoraceae bacterium]
MKPLVNPQITGLKESSTLAINQAALKARREGESVCHFGFGQSPFPVHPRIQIALAKNAHQKDYLPTLGLPSLCQAIADYHDEFFGYDFKPEYILIGPGSKELIFQALYVLEGSVLVPAPSWVSYGPQVNIRGKEIHSIQTARENGYKMQPAELQEACDKCQTEQKILILNNPSNPTGAVYDGPEIKALADVCRANNVIVISDEIYALVNFSGKKYSGFFNYYPEGTIVTSGLSKSHAAGGYRMGFLACGPNLSEVIKCLSAMVSETFSAVSAPIQYAAREAYCGDYDLMSYVKQCTRIHCAAGEYLWQRFEEMGLNCPKPEGAFYLFPDFNNYREKLALKGIKNSIQLAQYLFEQFKVAVLPGDDFYYNNEFLGVRVASVDYDGAKVYDASLAPLLKEGGKAGLDKQFVEEHCPNLKEGCDRLANFLKSL